MHVLFEAMFVLKIFVIVKIHGALRINVFVRETEFWFLGIYFILRVPQNVQLQFIN